MREAEYKFDLMAECPKCYNITDHVRMFLKDENGNNKEEWHKCMYCHAVSRVMKRTTYFFTL